MLEPFPGFATFTTHHCVSGSLRHIYDFHGLPLSEELLFGLGSGLGFVYFHFAGSTRSTAVGGNVEREGRGPRAVGWSAYGCRGRVLHHLEREEGAGIAADALEARQPVLLHLDMGFLPYFGLPDDYHFGGHVVVAAGFEPDTKRVLIADRDAELHPVDWEVLELARGSTFKPFPPRHEWFTFDFAPLAHRPFTTSARRLVMCAAPCSTRRSRTSA